MVAISLDIVIAIPVVIALAVLVSLTIVNLALSLQTPPVANIHTDLANETALMVDLNGDNDTNDVFWIVSGVIYLKGNPPSLSIEPVEKIIFEQVVGDEVRFAALVPYNTEGVVIKAGNSQVVVGLGKGT